MPPYGPFFQRVAVHAPGALRSDLSLSGQDGSGNLNPLWMKEFTAMLSEAVGQERFPGAPCPGGHAGGSTLCSVLSHFIAEKKKKLDRSIKI